MAIQKFFTSRSNTEGNTFVGEQDRLWFDLDTSTIYYSDGVTPGGIPLTGGANVTITGSNYGNANVAIYLPTDSTITSLQASIIAANVAWQANALAQQTQINSLSAGNYSNIDVSNYLPTDSTIIGIQANLTAGNVYALSQISTANTGMKGYVDSLVSTYSNVNVTAYLPTYSGNLSPAAIYTDHYFYANGSPFTGSGSSGGTTDLPTTFEVLSKNLKSYPYVINRLGGRITSVDYTTPYATVITKTLNYSGATILSIGITGANLSPLTYIKTLNYSGTDIVGATYSVV